MKLGVIVPQGWTGDYDGWEPERAWARTVAVAQQAERIGAESIWLFDHFHTVPKPTDEMTFESFTSLTALAALTERVRLGHIVICNGFRNPALTAKMASTLDTISGGRFELGIGAGWKRDEWMAYGYGFPETTRAPRDAARRARGDQPHARARPHDARDLRGRARTASPARINLPKPIQPNGMPIMVGGNGPNVTWRLAARYADELNVDGMSPDEVREALPTIRARCEEIGRDPDSLDVSVHVWWGTPEWRDAGAARQELLRGVRRPRRQPGDGSAPGIGRQRTRRSTSWRPMRERQVSSSPPGLRAVLVTGVYGVGKSTVVAQMADLLEARGLTYAAHRPRLAGWADDGTQRRPRDDRMLLANLDAVVRNYRERRDRPLRPRRLAGRRRRARAPALDHGDADARGAADARRSRRSGAAAVRARTPAARTTWPRRRPGWPPAPARAWRTCGVERPPGGRARGRGGDDDPRAWVGS